MQVAAHSPLLSMQTKKTASVEGEVAVGAVAVCGNACRRLPARSRVHEGVVQGLCLHGTRESLKMYPCHICQLHVASLFAFSVLKVSARKSCLVRFRMCGHFVQLSFSSWSDVLSRPLVFHSCGHSGELRSSLEKGGGGESCDETTGWTRGCSGMERSRLRDSRTVRCTGTYRGRPRLKLRAFGAAHGARYSHAAQKKNRVHRRPMPPEGAVGRGRQRDGRHLE